jgi:phosphoglycolate phosphatase
LLQSEPVHAALIDLDGTLIDALPDIHTAVNQAARRFALHEASLEDVRGWIGKGARRLMERLLRHQGDAPVKVTIDELLEAYLEEYTLVNGREARVYPEVIEGLKAMKSAGLKLACVTNKPEMLTRVLLEHTGLSQFFDVVVGGAPHLALKPAPDALLAACRALTCPVAATIMIGDSENDLEAARAAGMRCLLVPYGYSLEAPVQQLDADAIVPSLTGAAQWIAAQRP